ncbi:hypothetical protein Tco_0676001 [Tanacetum coccineum]
MTNAAIKQLIAQGVADVLAEIEANRTSRNGDNNHDSGTCSIRTERAARECTYSEFLKCQPLNFKGIEGVVNLTQWVEKMESVFHIRNCTIACQIKFATCTLLSSALTWLEIDNDHHFTKNMANNLPLRGGHSIVDPGGTEGPAKVTPLRVVIALRSSRGLGTVLLGNTP